MRWLYLPLFSLSNRTSTKQQLFGIFRFTSLVRIFTTSTLNSTRPKLPISSLSTSGRIVTKRSYLLFAWLRYLTLAHQQENTYLRVNITMLPATQSFYTITKAPMAHKTNSKEQFIFKFYHFAITFKIDQPLLASSLNYSTNVLAYVFYLTKRFFPIFETNLLFLKYYSVQYPLCDRQFFLYS